MSAADAERWDARHGVATAVAPMPPDAVRGREAWLPVGGRALDVGCGRGSVAVWLALRGFTVDALDVSAVALAAGAALASAHGVEERVRWLSRDLDTGLPAGRYDLVVCQRFRDPALYGALRAATAPGGLLVVTVLSVVGEGPGSYRAAPGELLAAFAGMDVIAHVEGDGEASIVARCSAQ